MTPEMSAATAHLSDPAEALERANVLAHEVGRRFRALERAMAAGKECPRCGETLPFEEFTGDASRPDGLSAYCRGCKAETARRYARARREVV